mmetsp:Transcript_974/g.2943  ORF Transcript_974/g.2943 Transcript_974/m.2943 type:complete len:258 (-) Transcript_974:275-1048(-)
MSTRIVHSGLPSSSSGSSKPTAPRRSSGRAATMSMALCRLMKKTQRLGQTANLTSSSIAKTVSKDASSTAARVPRKGGRPNCGPRVWRKVTTTLTRTVLTIHLTYHLAHLLDSGTSRKFQMWLAVALRLKCTSRCPTSLPSDATLLLSLEFGLPRSGMASPLSNKSEQFCADDAPDSLESRVGAAWGSRGSSRARGPGAPWPQLGAVPLLPLRWLSPSALLGRPGASLSVCCTEEDRLRVRDVRLPPCRRLIFESTV